MTERSRGTDEGGTMERMGRSMGGAAGKAADMAAGMAVPFLRGAADALGGWWSGDQAREAAQSWDAERDRACRQDFERRTAGSGTTGQNARSYDEVRPFYQLGHTASRNPEYASRNFEEVEPELRRVWAEGETGGSDEWPKARGFVEFGYGEGRKDERR